MSRLSREKKREQKRAARSAPAASPFEVRVPVDGPGAGGASIGGVPVTVPPGEEIQQVVLTHLHRIATATGHPVHATIHDDRIGYVVPLQIDLDGSTHFTAEPRATGARQGWARSLRRPRVPVRRRAFLRRSPRFRLRFRPRRRPQGS